MKKCPLCKADVDDNFQICWNCQYSFVDEKVLNRDDFKVVCPSCNIEVDASLTYCPNCQSDLAVKFDKENDDEKGPKELYCLRCNVQLCFQGNFRFHEGTRIGALGDLFELFTNRESFDLYYCPNCGKVEFFLPEYN
jgi:Zn finger protein HypA/HybF involved in hydrogenase expression